MTALSLAQKFTGMKMTSANVPMARAKMGFKGLFLPAL